MDPGLKGKRAIMCGGAHGLGLASSKLFAAEAVDVAFFGYIEDKVAAGKAIVFTAGPAIPCMTGFNKVIDGGFAQRVQF